MTKSRFPVPPVFLGESQKSLNLLNCRFFFHIPFWTGCSRPLLLVLVAFRHHPMDASIRGRESKQPRTIRLHLQYTSGIGYLLSFSCPVTSWQTSQTSHSPQVQVFRTDDRRSPGHNTATGSQTAIPLPHSNGNLPSNSRRPAPCLHEVFFPHHMRPNLSMASIQLQTMMAVPFPHPALLFLTAERM